MLSPTWLFDSCRTSTRAPEDDHSLITTHDTNTEDAEFAKPKLPVAPVKPATTLQPRFEEEFDDESTLLNQYMNNNNNDTTANNGQHESTRLSQIGAPGEQKGTANLNELTEGESL